MLSTVRSAFRNSSLTPVGGKAEDSSWCAIQVTTCKSDVPSSKVAPSICMNCKAPNGWGSVKLSKSFKPRHPSPMFGDAVEGDSPIYMNSKLASLSITNGTGLSDGERSHEENEMNDMKVPGYAMMMPHMKKGYSSLGGVTIERTKLDLSVKETKSSPQLDIGGGGGNIGNKNFHGGGDGGDDDDYFGGEDDGEDGDDGGILRKTSLKEIFDRATVEAVMKEWFKTMSDLPAGIRQAVELGVMSTAQLVRYFSIGSRPTLTRKVSRLIPEGASRSFLGRVMADPAFMFKFGMEQAFTLGTSILHEVQSRGEKLKDEADLAAANVLFLLLSNAFIVWKLSPSRSYWSTARYDWQKLMERLPNHVFDKSYPLREISLPMRVSSFFFRSAQLCFAGSVIGSINGLLSNALVDLRKKSHPEYSPSIPTPTVQTCALANGAFLGLSGNVRYQMVYGLERVMGQHLNSLTMAILGSTALRYANIRLGESSRISWLGLDIPANNLTREDKPHHSTAAYHRPSLSGSPSAPSFSLPFDLPPALLGALPFLANVVNSPSKPPASQPPSQPSRRLRRKVKRKVSMAT